MSEIGKWCGAEEAELLRARFLKSVTPGDPQACWLWGNGKLGGGYANLWWRDKKLKGTHVSLFLFRSESVPAGKVACHTCDTPACVNPNHLWVGTVQDNALDSVAKGRHVEASKTHCPKGHAYDGVRGNGERVCKTCKSIVGRRTYRRRRERSLEKA